MKRITTIILATLALFIPACDDPDQAEFEVDDEVEELEFRAALNHPSGICRIESETGFSHKRVLYFHKSKPNLEHDRDYCDPWVGTAECCKKMNPYGLSYDQCAQLRHAPDCKVSGDGGGEGPGDQQQK